jgi:hypothetical protein
MGDEIPFPSLGWNEISNPVAGSDNRGGAMFIGKPSHSTYNTRYVKMFVEAISSRIPGEKKASKNIFAGLFTFRF